jgi:predicted TIM-barrel fold metal-dependent hydrolase
VTHSSTLDIIDAHQHVGDLSDSLTMDGAAHGQRESEDVRRERDVAKRLALLDQQHVRQSVIIASHAYLRPDGIADTRRVNEGVVRYCQVRPDRFPYPVGVVEPLYGERGLAELDRCRDELGMTGISFHTRFQGVALDSPWMFRYLERMGELGLVPFVHALGVIADQALWRVDKLARAMPDLTMVVLAGFADAETPLQLHDVADRNPNLVFDISLAINFETFVEPAVRRLGAHRFVFGSDTYSAATRPGHVLGQLLGSAMADADKAAIAGGNIRRVLSAASR